MKKKLSTLSALSVCISLAINGQASADTLPADIAMNADTSMTCPADISSLTPEQLAALPENCQVEQNMIEWLEENNTVLSTAGATALAATLAIVASNSGSSGSKSGRNDPYAGWDVGNRIRGDGQFNQITDKVTAGKGQIGNLIIGNETKNEIIGDTEVKDGGKGNVIEGDNTSTIVIGDTIVEGEGSVGHEVIGENNELIVEDGTSVSDGGTGTIIRGDDGKTVVIGDTIVEGEGSTGHEIIGDRGELVAEGGTSVSDGGTGTIIRGDEGKTEVIGETIVEGEGSTGHEIIGDRGELVVEGDTSVSDGGTGTIIRGDEGKTVVVGETIVEGEGSIGHEIIGDRGELVIEGDSSVSDGGTGTIIRGDDGKTVVVGDTIVEGEGSTGHEIIGDRGELVIEGDTSVSDGGTGTIVRGDDANVVVIGDTIVDGSGSVGHNIIGDNATVRLEGDTTASNGGTGVIVGGEGANIVLEGQIQVGAGSTGVTTAGDRAQVTNRGDIYVNGEGALGLNISSNDARFSNIGNLTVTNKGMGAVLAGDRFEVNLGGNVLVDAGATREHATGIVVSGDQGVLNISGNVEVRDVLMSVAGTRPVLTGIDISGEGNRVNIDGALSVNYEGSVASRPDVGYGNRFEQRGLLMRGDGNQVNITGGLNLVYKAEQSPLNIENAHGTKQAALIDGNNNQLSIGGDSLFHLDGKSNPAASEISYIVARGENNRVILNDDFRLDIKFSDQLEPYEHAHNLIIGVQGQNSVVENYGSISANRGGMFLLAGWEGGSIINHGHLAFNHNKVTFESVTSALMYPHGGNAVNQSAGVLDVISAQDGMVDRYGWGGGITSLIGMLTAGGGSDVFNEGTINVRGQNAHGTWISTGSTGVNNGLISINAMSNDVDADGNLLRETGLWGVATDYRRGSAMVASRIGSLAVNSGEIQVHNAGIGMAAVGGVVANEGTITLTADNALADALYAMAAFDGGVAINDTTGVININTPLGFAFHQAGSGIIVNRGTVNLNGTAIGETDTNWGAPTTPGVDVDISRLLAATGETRTIGGSGGNELIFVSGLVENHGTTNATTDITFKGTLHNIGTLSSNNVINAGAIQNDGILRTGLLNAMPVNATLINNGTVEGTVAGKPVIQNFSVWNEAGAVIRNTAGAIVGERINNSVILVNGSSPWLVNHGDIIATNGYGAITTQWSGAQRWLMNMESGRIIGENPLQPLIQADNGSNFYNAGEISVKGNNAVAISAMNIAGNARVINEGVINVGTEEGKADGNNGTGLVGMLGGGTATNTVYNNTSGVINVWADDSHAFAKTNANSTIINNGTVNLLCDTGCGVFKDSATGASGDDYVVPEHHEKPVIVQPTTATRLAGYVVGTNSDGTAGKLSGRSLALDDVKVDHAFTAGTASKMVTFSDVFKADSISGEENVRAQSVVWNAKAEKNAKGNVDVTMTKNDYATVASDTSVGGVAAALDKGYTNNALFNSLNVSSASALNSALKQISGAQANSLNKEARVLGQRFNMLAETAPVTTPTGLSFNVIAKGDKRAEMDNKVTYDMMALRQQFDTGLGSLSATYGMARLTGSGGNESTRAGDNGLTGGYSQFFGLDHSLAFGETYSWNNSLRADLHTLESRRSISFEGVNRSATASGKQQHLEFRSEGVKNLEVNKGLTLAPFAGLKMRHHITDGYKENGAGDFNLSMNRYSETAVDAVTGLRLNYAGQNGWGAQATLEAGPNLSFSQSQRKASLQGLQGHQFSVNDGKKSGGLNSKAMAGVNYQSEKVSFGMNAFQWQEDGVGDKGFLFNVSRHF